ncbi:MAG: hypothetical protein JWO22_1747 [Frankiales bacterium]|nr:hypothetical protein [Frankiales bacterium]
MTHPADGRRDNGLPSTEWGALVDLDPRLSDSLLESLAAEGVPAYVEPARDVDSYTRATTLPKRPLDRLWVDPAQADLARACVTAEVIDLAALLEPGTSPSGLVRPVPRTAAARVLAPPELPSTAISPIQPPVGGDALPSDDELFRQIVAGFSSESGDPVPRWPVAEDVDSDAPPSSDAPRRRRTDRSSAASEVEGLPSWVEPAALEDDGHYEPPAPPKVGRPRGRTVMSLLMVVVGFLAIFAPTLVLLTDDPLSLVFGLALTVGGAALLVMSMRDAPPTDSDPDDGAVV